MLRVLPGLLIVALLAGCGVSESLTVESDETTGTTAGLTWQQFRAKVFQEPDTGLFVADGDTLFSSEKKLREFFDLHVATGQQLAVDRVGSADDKWDNQQKLNLTYCINSSFGSRKTQLVNALDNAGQQWMSAANVRFVYVPAQDGNCTKSNTNVVFNVRMVSGASYLARSFFPMESRNARELVVDTSSFESNGLLVAIMLHELGHTLGFRHEHTRPEAGTCFEDNSWRALTPYDVASTMHYPQCNGLGNWTTTLSALDRQGAAALYGAPGGSTPPSTPPPTTPSNGDTVSFTVGKGQAMAVGPYDVVPGGAFQVEMTGSGDADLYVRFGQAPTATAYHCRPYLDGSQESCSLTVPSGQTKAFVTVYGYTAASVQVKVAYSQGTSSPPPSTGGTPQSGTASGSVGERELIHFDPISVKPGTTFKVTMSGSGDPDLYVRFGAKASLTVFDCRPYVDGPFEECNVTVPAGQTQAYLAVHGYRAGSYSLDVAWTAP